MHILGAAAARWLKQQGREASQPFLPTRAGPQLTAGELGRNPCREEADPVDRGARSRRTRRRGEREAALRPAGPSPARPWPQPQPRLAGAESPRTGGGGGSQSLAPAGQRTMHCLGAEYLVSAHRVGPPGRSPGEGSGPPPALTCPPDASAFPAPRGSRPRLVPWGHLAGRTLDPAPVLGRRRGRRGPRGANLGPPSGAPPGEHLSAGG